MNYLHMLFQTTLAFMMLEMVNLKNEQKVGMLL